MLIHGHFDVQPAGPFDLWTYSPFVPEVRAGRPWGRGASNDGRGSLIPILAFEAVLRTTGCPPVQVKVFCEGPEEIVPPDPPPFVAANADIQTAGRTLSADGLQGSPDVPMVVVGKRVGVLENHRHGARSHQHSGLHRGRIAKPAMALGQIPAS